MDIFADPVERVQIAQAALAFLQIGFDDIAAVAQSLVPLVALGQLVGNELALGALRDVLSLLRCRHYVTDALWDARALRHKLTGK